MARGATNALGLDIGGEAIKAVQLRKAKEGLQLVGRPACVPTPPGSVAGGVIVEGEAISAALAEMVASCGFTTKHVVASVGGNTSVTVRVASMPRMSGRELSDAMDYELDRQIPFPIDQVIYDYQIVDSPDRAESDEMSVLLAAAQEDMINAHVEAIMAARLQPVHIGIEPLALSRALVNVSTNGYNEQTVVIAHIGASQTEISVVHRGYLDFVRAIPTAGRSLTAAIRQEITADETQAEQAKRQFADARELSGPEAGESEEAQQARQAVQDVISEPLFELVTEISRTVDFYRRQHPGDEISRLLLAGGSAVIPGLAELVASETGVATEVANPYQHLIYDVESVSEAYLRDIGPATAVAVGLAMRDMLPD